MVESSSCRMRLQEYRDIGGGILGDLPNHIKAAHPQLLRLHMYGKPADAAGYSEISAPTNVLDVSTAVQFETISGSANDNLTAGAHAQKIMAIGINELNKLETVELDGHATDWTTFVLHTETMKDIFHAYCSAWGTGDKDNAGQIDVRKIDDTILVSILAAGNESNGSRFKVPDGHVAMLFGGKLIRRTATGAWANDEGIRIRLVYVDPIDGQSGLAAADRHLNFLKFTIAGQYGIQEMEIPKGMMFESGTWLSWEHSSAVNAGENYRIIVDYLIWEK